MSDRKGNWKEVTRHAPCAICHHDHWCSVAADGARTCRRVDTGTGRRRLDRDGGEFWYYPPNGRLPTETAPDLPDLPAVPPADVATRDRVYRALLGALTLDARHREDLRRRGLSDAEIDRRGYRSLPARGRRQLAETLSRRFGPEVCAGVPGWYVRKEDDRRWPSWSGCAGLLIPVRDGAGRIVALKVRADLDGREGSDIPRYSWISSASKEGAGPGSPAHVPLYEGDTVTVRLTEGPLKADVATALSGVLTIGLAGVSALRPAFSLLREIGAKRLLLAFDADSRRKEHVAGALRRAWRRLAEEKYEVGLEVWDESHGKGIDDVLAGGSTEILEGGKAELWLAEETQSQDAARPTICVSGRHLHAISDDCCRVLREANVARPALFRQGTAAVRLIRNSPAVAEALTVPALRGFLDRHAWFVKMDDQNHSKPARPPVDVVQDLLALPDLPLPRLEGVRSFPVFLPGGRLLTQDGYDAETGWFLSLADLPQVQTDLPIGEALRFLWEELLADFPFVSDGDRAHALALLLEPFVRPMIEGPTPVYLVDAPARGTGKGLLVEVTARTAVGSPAEVMTVTGGEEMEKRITATLITNAPMILLDNATSLGPACLAAAITATTWRGRVLGVSRMVSLPVRVTWAATGNNVALADEMARRVIPIRLDAGVERPEERTAFRHPDLRAWVREQRRALVSACLSIVQAWIDAGMPAGQRTLGSFEAWARVLGGILDCAGVPGFLTDRDRVYQEADRETEEWQALCAAWWEAHGPRPVAAGEVLAVARAHELLLDVWASRTDLGARQRIGHALAERRDRRFGAWVLRSAGHDPHRKAGTFRLEEARQKTPQTPQTPPLTPGGSVDEAGFPPPLGSQTPHREATNPAGVQAANTGFAGFAGFSSGTAAEAEEEWDGVADAISAEWAAAEEPEASEHVSRLAAEDRPPAEEDWTAALVADPQSLDYWQGTSAA